MEMLRSRPNMIYSDNFTPKSFVSHSANMKKEELSKINLLSKNKRTKALLTPELSPTFTKKDDDLQEMLGIMIRILGW